MQQTMKIDTMDRFEDIKAPKAPETKKMENCPAGWEEQSINEGAYQILQNVNPENNTEYEVIEILGAKILKGCLVPTEVERLNKESGEIKNVHFYMPDDSHLGDVFNQIPYGVLNKNKTGVGATTLELESKRNSIIVVPTRTLAYTKWLNNQRIWLYVGSAIGKLQTTTSPQIQDYINRIERHNKIDPQNFLYKKFIVVADSLEKVIKTIGKENLKNYFLMIDEVDIIQSDSTYRPNLEKAIDYSLPELGYFDEKHSCLVSATIRPFSHPQMNQKASLVARFPFKQDTPPKLIHSITPNKTACEEIANIPKDEKVLIAYNSIDSILEIIDMLDPNLVDECGIMCSTQSKDKVEFYKEGLYVKMDNQSLPKRITFMTCVYFVGIDIKESYHLISVANIKKPHSLLSFDKLKQIRGRCRETGGIKSDTIIYNTKPFSATESLEEYHQKLLLKAKAVRELYKGIDHFLVSRPESEQEMLKPIFDRAKSGIEKYATETTFSKDQIPLTRQRIDGLYDVAYFNIDALMETRMLIERIYSDKSIMEEHYKTTAIIKDAEPSLEQEINEFAISQHSEKFKQKVFQEARQSLLELNEPLNDAAIDNLIRESTNDNQKDYYKKVKLLYRYVSLPSLCQHIEDNFYKTSFDNFYNGVIFKALSEDNNFKSRVLNEFEFGKTYKKEEILETFGNIVSEILGRNMSERNKMNFFNSLLETRPNRQRTQREILDYKFSEEILETLETHETYKYFLF